MLILSAQRPFCNSPVMDMAANFPPSTFCHSFPNTNLRALFYMPSPLSNTKLRALRKSLHQNIPCTTLRCAKRTGKRRYPSEKKKLERVTRTLTQFETKGKEEGFWRFSNLAVPVHKDPGKDFIGVSLPLLESISKVLEFPVAAMLPMDAFTVVRKSFDARKLLKEPQFVYIVDMDVKKLLNLEPHAWDFISKLEPKLGFIEYMSSKKVPSNLISMLHDFANDQLIIEQEEVKDDINIKSFYRSLVSKRPKVAVVGSGPSGLFASLVLSELGADVTLIERGQAVEQRGRDIGALVVQRALQHESNFCYGESRPVSY